MGQVIICSPVTAAEPYQMKFTSTNLYTIEELCFYLYENLYLIDESIMDVKLCKWIEQQLKDVFLAQKLMDALRENAPLGLFVKKILEISGYCDESELQHVQLTLEEISRKSKLQRRKIRADRLVENANYAAALYEYQHVLHDKEIAGEEKKLIGSVYHNIGVCFANMFLYDEAAKNFAKAYAIGGGKYSYQCQKKAQALMSSEEIPLTEEEEQQFENIIYQAKDSHAPGINGLLHHVGEECRRMSTR